MARFVCSFAIDFVKSYIIHIHCNTCNYSYCSPFNSISFLIWAQWKYFGIVICYCYLWSTRFNCSFHFFFAYLHIVLLNFTNELILPWYLIYLLFGMTAKVRSSLAFYNLFIPHFYCLLLKCYGHAMKACLSIAQEENSKDITELPKIITKNRWTNCVRIYSNIFFYLRTLEINSNGWAVHHTYY